MERDSTLTRGVKSVRGLYGRYGRWGKKLGAAITDQALFAGSNFIVNWLLALWLPKEEFGVVVVAFTWFLLIQTFYEALTVSPMSYYGSGKYSKYFRRYLGFIFQAHVFLSTMIGIGFGIAALLIYADQPLLGTAMAGTAVASVFLLARGLIRQPFYILSNPQGSVVGGAIYLVVNVVCTILLHLTNVLTPFTALIGMGIAGLVTTIVQVYMLKPEFKTTEANAELTRRMIIKDHWSYGKWSLSSRSLAWLATNFGVLFIPLVIGFSGSATLRAIMNLVQPIFQANAALITLLVPTFVRTYQAQGKGALNSSVKKIISMVIVVTGGYFLFLTLFGRPLIHLLYGGTYDEEATLAFIMCVAALPMITTISRVLDAALSGMGRVKLSFQSKIIPTTLTVILDIFLVTAFGPIGFAVESLLTASLTLIQLVGYYLRAGKTPRGKNDPLETPPIVTEPSAPVEVAAL